MNTELVVLPGGGAGVGEQVLQPLLALSVQPVDDLRPAWRATVPAGGAGRAQRTGRSGRWGGLVAFPGDQALGVQLVQAGVQRAVGERPERAEQHVQLLTELVAVHRRSVQQPKHGELQHATPVPAHGIPPYAYGFYVSSRYLYPISRFDISGLTIHSIRKRLPAGNLLFTGDAQEFTRP